MSTRTDAAETRQDTGEASAAGTTRTISTLVPASTHRRLRTLSAMLDVSNAEVIDRGLRLLELRVVAENELHD